MCEKFAGWSWCPSLTFHCPFVLLLHCSGETPDMVTLVQLLSPGQARLPAPGRDKRPVESDRQLSSASKESYPCLLQQPFQRLFPLRPFSYQLMTASYFTVKIIAVSTSVLHPVPSWHPRSLRLCKYPLFWVFSRLPCQHSASTSLYSFLKKSFLRLSNFCSSGFLHLLTTDI